MNNKEIIALSETIHSILMQRFGGQLTSQDREDIHNDTITKLLSKYKHKWEISETDDITRLGITIAKNFALKKIKKNSYTRTEEIKETDAITTPIGNEISLEKFKENIVYHPELVKKPKYQFVIEKILEYEGEYTGKDLYEVMIDEYEAKFDTRPNYEAYRKIKSRAGILLKKVLYQLI